MFRIASGTTASLAQQMAVANPLNPFYTPGYAAYRRSQGFICWIMMNEAVAGPDIYCPAFMKTGRLRRLLEVPSVPEAPLDRNFWQGLLDFCRSFLRRLDADDAVAAWRLVAGESGRFPEVGRIFHERAVRLTETTLANFLTRFIASGELRDEGAARMAEL
ncbi:MAG: TetR/AcrR family transcriptional regulator C-terminal domain-containing protein, partial [Nitrosospira sp.]|nr:TetR/AcrR family transcriptional regulator C-terminal domain-containing protein [Nitrosospira sp.]